MTIDTAIMSIKIIRAFPTNSRLSLYQKMREVAITLSLKALVSPPPMVTALPQKRLLLRLGQVCD